MVELAQALIEHGLRDRARPSSRNASSCKRLKRPRWRTLPRYDLAEELQAALDADPHATLARRPAWRWDAALVEGRP